MERQPINTEKFLEKVEKTELGISEKELTDSLGRLSEPFETIVDFGDEQDIEIYEAGVKINITYKPLTYPDPDGGMQVYGQHREVEKFIVEFDDNKISLFDLMPPETKIICFSSRDSWESLGAVNARSGSQNIRDIVIRGPLNSIEMFAILFHEVGHVLDYQKLDELGLETMMDDGENSKIAETLRKERVATAFALKVLRPFLTDKTKRRDLKNILKHQALKSYYDDAKLKLEEKRAGIKPAGDLGHSAKDFMEDYEQFIDEELE